MYNNLTDNEREVMAEMSESERNIAKILAEAGNALPELMKERLLGYAEGVADMAKDKDDENFRQPEK